MLAWFLVHLDFQGFCHGRDSRERGGAISRSLGGLQGHQTKESVQLGEGQILVQKLFHLVLFARDYLDFGLLQQFRHRGAVHFRVV